MTAEDRYVLIMYVQVTVLWLGKKLARTMSIPRAFTDGIQPPTLRSSNCP